MNEAPCLDTMRLSQPQYGYRFSADAVALADFAHAGRLETVLDLCSGCGVVPILIWQRCPFRSGLGVELDPELAMLAARNVKQFGLDGKIHIVQGDVKSLSADDLRRVSPALSSELFDVITANPPYWPAEQGRLNPNLQKAVARHEMKLTLRDVLATAWRFLRPGGKFFLSHLESRKNEILSGFERQNLIVQRTQQIPNLPGRMLFEARLVS